MSDNKVAVSEAVMERVNAEIVRSIMQTPDYIQSIVAELLQEKQPYNSFRNDPDVGKPMFEVLLRRQIRTMIEQSLTQALRERYKDAIDDAVTGSINKEEKLEGSLAYAFAQVLKADWKINVNTTFRFESEKD